MKIQVGDIVGLKGEITGHTVERIIIGRGWQCYVLDDGREPYISDIFVCRSDNGDGTVTETFSDGRVRKVELD